MATVADPVKWTEAAMTAALREKFPEPEFAFLAQVCNATGARHTRTVDGLAFSCWPSRGLALYGFEIKVSRQDWLKEKSDPAKAEAVCKFCDYWYVVAAPKVVGEGELPPNWGLMEPRGGKLVVKREAPRLDAQPLSRTFLAAVFRRAADAAKRVDVQAEVERARAAAHDAGVAYGEKRQAATVEKLAAELDDLRSRIREFEQASGLQFGRWTSGHKMGDAVRFVMAGGLANAAKEMEATARTAQAVLYSIEEWRKTVRNIKGDPC